MDIFFADNKMERTFGDEAKLNKKHGQLAPFIKRRLAILQESPTLADVPTAKPERCHQLTADRKGQFAVDLKQPYRLTFQPVEPVPVLDDGSIDKGKVTKILILEVVNYHD